MDVTEGIAGARRREPSMADVAQLAGVSGQTVSRVANGRAYVGAQTRERVLAAMREVGYRPNGAARALRTGRFRSIGVIMFSLSSYGNTRTLEAIAGQAARDGYSITLIPLGESTQQGVTDAFARLGEQAVDGVIILIEAHRLDDAEIELPEGLPVVVLDSRADYPYPVVDTDQSQGARIATEHLLELGHRTVAHVAGPHDSYSATRRLESWQATLAAHGAPVPEPLRGDWTADSGYRAGLELAADPGVTAVFVANDQMALGLLRALREQGRDVPGDVSVVGFDDSPEAANFSPPLTTVRQHFELVGRKAMRALVEEIDGAPRGDRELVPTELVVRRTTAPPRV